MYICVLVRTTKRHLSKDKPKNPIKVFVLPFSGFLFFTIMEQIIKPLDMMSSKRIAEKTGKEHSNVLRDIRNMIGELSESQDSNLNPDEYEEVKARNGMTAEILLNERLSLCLASGYSISLRMMIIDDWALMKRNLNKTKEFTTKELLLLQLETIERAEKAEKTVAILTHVNKTYTSTEIAKELGFKSANEMNKKLHDLGIQYKQNDTWILYSKYSGLAYVDIKQEVLDYFKEINQ